VLVKRNEVENVYHWACGYVLFSSRILYLLPIAFALSKRCCHCFAGTGARHRYMTVVGTAMMMTSGTGITTWQLLLIT
jgi:hypothetical protein